MEKEKKKNSVHESKGLKENTNRSNMIENCEKYK
jgi:hypothetical protein